MVRSHLGLIQGSKTPQTGIFFLKKHLLRSFKCGTHRQDAVLITRTLMTMMNIKLYSMQLIHLVIGSLYF